MKARYVFERQNFERGQDPKQTMGIGVKTRFFKYFPNSLESELSEYFEWKKVKEVIKKPTTQIKFEYKTSSKNVSSNFFMTIKLSPNDMNVFFFKYLQKIIDSHGPKKLYHFVEKDNEVTYYIPKHAIE